MLNIVINEWMPVYIFNEKSNYIINCNTAQIINIVTGIEIKHSKDKDGYHRVTLWYHGKYKNFRIHRLVYISFCGDSEFNDIITDVNHIDGNKNNNALSNLEACSTKYNIQHAIVTGLRNNIGSKCSLSKYSDDKINEILDLLEQGYSNKEISKKINMPLTNISDIKRKRTWKHLSVNRKLPNWNHHKSNEIVINIINDILFGLSNKEISNKYNIDHKYISLIRNKKRHLELYNQIKSNMCVE